MARYKTAPTAEMNEVTTSPAQPAAVTARAGDTNEVVSDRDQEEVARNIVNSKKRKRTTKSPAAAPLPNKDAHAKESSQAEEYDSDDGSAMARPSKKSKQTTSAAEGTDEVESMPVKKVTKTPPPDAVIQAFMDAIPTITNWSSNNDAVSDVYCNIVKWLDKDDLPVEKVAELYHAAGYGIQDPSKRSPNSEKNICKLYNNWAPKFYAEKGITFVGRQDRKKLGKPSKAKKAAAPKQKRTKTQAVSGGIVGEGAVAPNVPANAPEHALTFQSRPTTVEDVCANQEEDFDHERPAHANSPEQKSKTSEVEADVDVATQDWKPQPLPPYYCH
ncbi:hypothetical protein EK21DRAFT_90239 [Setomelanomma holmii]|uniref:Uncharacterized protein n=1 Tax=Setomelanomma holmii TaxID=210430 RepID=A0A9P4H7B5_9PLEO|nr:hypothetical protein EK21DRAFT_90239 [Setomelanomma holmii]